MNTFLQCCEGAVNILKCSCDVDTVTNWQEMVQNIAIVFLICATIVIVARIVWCTFLSWKREEIAAQKEERNFQKTKEEEECKRKQKADLQSKLVDFRKALAFPYEKGKDIHFEKKEFDKDESDAYIKLLEKLLEITK